MFFASSLPNSMRTAVMCLHTVRSGAGDATNAAPALRRGKQRHISSRQVQVRSRRSTMCSCESGADCTKNIPRFTRLIVMAIQNKLVVINPLNYWFFFNCFFIPNKPRINHHSCIIFSIFTQFFTKHRASGKNINP